jgi:hypothetical protein
MMFNTSSRDILTEIEDILLFLGVSRWEIDEGNDDVGDYIIIRPEIKIRKDGKMLCMPLDRE